MKAAFARIDPILDAWAKKFGLHIYHHYKDDEVRGTTVVDDQGTTYGIGLQDVGDSYLVTCGWTLGKKVNRQHVSKSWERQASIEELPVWLDEAYAVVERWIAENGNTRTWVNA